MYPEGVEMNYENVFPSGRQVFTASGITFATLAVMACLHWLGFEAGALMDWVVGIAGFWWLLGITTVPWNLYFAARGVQQEIVLSAQRGLDIEATDARFVGRTAHRSLGFALLLHLATAAGFAALAHFEVTSVGWIACGISLALTFVRPVVRLYAHIAATLRAIGRRVRYPRDDVRTALEKLEQHGALLQQLDREERDSWSYSVEGRISALQKDLERTRRALESQAERNAREHRNLERSADEAVQRLGEDAQFLGNVRELLRFVKEA
jgi:hypothetical protein